MIKPNPANAHKRYGPGGRELAWSALKGAGMGALVAVIVVKLVA